MTDSQHLLAEYARNGSDAAFRELATRYVDLVYSTALRLVEGDTHRAEDVTQTVFVDLSHKARTLPPDVRLGGWLHRDTCLVAGHTLRGERRRQSRERQAAEMNALQNHSQADFSQVAPLLDEAINGLGEADRTAILLRFFEQQDFRAVGQALGSNEDAARMRVTRALEKLEEFLKRRGVTTTAASLGVVLAANAVQAAPVGLAVTISTAAALAGATATIATQAAMNWINIKSVSTIVAAAIVAATGTHLVQHREATRLRDENQNLIAERVRLTNERDAILSATAANKDEIERLQKNQTELLRLRGEVGLLRRQLKSQNGQAAQQPVPASRARLAPSAFVSKDQLTNAGFATPEAALQTFMHGMVSGNLDQVVSAFSSSAQDPADLINDPEKRREFEKASHEAASSFQGQQILAKKVVSDYRVDLEVLIYSEGKFPDATIQRMVKEGNEWKCAGSYGVSQSSTNDDQIQLFAPSVSQ